MRPLTKWQEFKKRFPINPLGLLQENKKRRDQQVSHNFSVRTHLRRTKQTTFLLALQQLACSSGSPTFKNFNRTSKLPKSLTTTMPKFDEKSENVKLPGDLFHASLKIHNQPTEEDRIHYFHFLKRGDALQTFKKISSPSKENLAELLTVFRRKQVKPQSMATAKHKFQWLVFNPANWKLMEFFGRVPDTSKRRNRSCCPGDNWAIQIFKNASTPETINEPGSLGERHIWTDCVPSGEGVTAEWFGSSRQNANKHCNATCYKTKPWATQTDTSSLQKAGPLSKPVSSIQEKDKNDTNKNGAGSNNKINNNRCQTNSNIHSNKTVRNGNANSANNWNDRKLGTVYPPCETCGKANHSTENCFLELMQHTDRLLGTED